MQDRVKKFNESTFVLRLAQRMAEKGLSQEGLAKLSGVSQSAISRWLTGESAPKLPHVVEVAEVLECEIGWLSGIDSAKTGTELSGADYVGPVTAQEKTALGKALTVLRSKGVRGHPDQTLASNIETCFETVRYAEELGDSGGHVHGEGSAASSARKRRVR
jgi:transcriptional regulator with XRE-family HTH domain